MKSKTLYYDMLTLSVYRELLETDVGETMLAYLESINSDDTEEMIISCYAEFVNSLFLEGGNISEFIRSYLNRSEDPYIKLITKKKDIPTQLKKAQEHDLQTLQKLASITSEELISYSGTDYNLPGFDTSDINIITEFQDMIESCDSKGYGIFTESCMFRIMDDELVPVLNPEFQKLNQFYGYKLEREQVLKNTEALALGKNASNVLLYGDAGTGKSSTVKACAAAFWDQGVRLIEFSKNEVEIIPTIAESLKDSPLKFIFYIDDLSFSGDDDGFYALKGILEGNISGCSNNIVIYATSNRRHLIRESMADREGTELHLNDTLQETMSLSARFGLTITFSKPAKDLYIEIVLQLAEEYGLDYEEQDLIRRAEAFAIRANGRSPRTAKQFIILASNNLR